MYNVLIGGAAGQGVDTTVAILERLLNHKGGRSYGALVFGDIWPLPQKLLRKAAASAKAILHVEQNYTGQLASLVREVTEIRTDVGILRYDGRQLSGEEIAERVEKEGY